MERLLVVGLDEPEFEALKSRVDVPMVFHPDLPRVKLQRGRLLVEHPDRMAFLAVGRVIFHGIFEDDFDLLAALALWRGPCLPGALGLLDCRLRIPCLARSLAISRFSAMPRGFAYGGEIVKNEDVEVAKWGNWHCGEDKERSRDDWRCPEPTIVEPFIEGDAERIMIVGERFWQIHLAGQSWKKSIHHHDAAILPIEQVDPELLEDTRSLAKHFGLEMIGVDYMVGADGERHLLEVNHVPNVTVFPEIREAFLDLAERWIKDN